MYNGILPDFLLLFSAKKIKQNKHDRNRGTESSRKENSLQNTGKMVKIRGRDHARKRY